MSGDYDVVICGGGVAGAAAAALLARAGFHVALVDPRRPGAVAAEAEFDPRVVALSPGARRVLAAAGAWERVPAARIAPYARMQVHSASGWIDFSAAEHGLAHLGWIAEIPTPQHAVWQALEDMDNVSLLAPASVTDCVQREGHVRLRLDGGKSLRTRLVIAADGARSRLRRQAGIAARQWHYNQHALVTHITTDKPNAGLAWQRFTEHGPLALLPLPDGRSSIVWSQASSRAAAMRALDEPAFVDELNQHQDSPFGRATTATRRHVLPLVRRQSRRLVAGRLVLLGDAARTVHPLAGQGLNLGVMDAAALAEVLGDWQPDTPPDSALARYERWRLSAGTLVAGGIHAINELTAGNAPGRLLAGLGLGLAARAWPLRESFVQRACGIDSDSPRLAREAR